MNSENSESFVRRFNSFYDAVIREIKIQFSRNSAASNLEILFSTRDLRSGGDGEWVNVSLLIHEVTAFSFSESSKESYLVLSNGLTIAPTGDQVFFDFGYFDDLPTDARRFTESKFYVIGRSFDWEVLPYES